MAGNKKSLEFQVPLNHSATAVWNALGTASAPRTLVELAPETYSSIDGGPWDHEGAIVFVKYANGQPNSKLTLEMLDHAAFAKRIRYVEEGGSSHDHSISLKLIHGPNSDSCVFQISIEYDGNGEEKFFETRKESYIRVVEILDSRLNAKLNHN